jgi:Domain of unknown function (DUF3127)
MQNKKQPLQISGSIVNFGNAIQGESWIKQDFTIRTDGEYPVLVNFITFNSAQDQLSRCKLNDQVTVFFNPESKGYADKDGVQRYFNELKAWKVQIDFNNGGRQ